MVTKFHSTLLQCHAKDAMIVAERRGCVQLEEEAITMGKTKSSCGGECGKDSPGGVHAEEGLRPRLASIQAATAWHLN